MDTYRALLVGVLAVAFTAVPLPGLAEGPHNAFYAGGAIGQSRDRDSCENSLVPCDDSDVAWRVFGGYQVHRNLAVELGYADLGKVKRSGVQPNGIDFRSEFESTAWDLVAVGVFPIGDRFSVHAKLGVYYGEREGSGSASIGGSSTTFGGSDSNTDVTFGVGLGVDLGRRFGLRAEYQKYQHMGGDNTAKSSVELASVALLYRFR